MIGNDIIDLKEAQTNSNWKRPGFLEKIFNPSEQNLIHEAKNSFEMVWRLWSMKESGYKFYMQKDPNAVRGFYPSKINCEIVSNKAGLVFIQGNELKTNTISDSNYMFSTAFSDENIPTKTSVFQIPIKQYQFQSNFIREKLFEHLERKEQLYKTHLKIKKDKNQTPLIFYKKELIPFSCSLTHHGNYGGFSIISN